MLSVTPKNSTLLTPDQWATIRRLVDWVDRANGRSPHEVSMRILKITEEKGEVADAYLGMTGQNEDATYNLDDVTDELCDVMLSAAVALVTVAGDTAEDLLAVQWEDIRRDSRGFVRCFLEITKHTGRAASAYIGMTGQNPRKGVTHTRAEVADRLCDVFVAAAVALASVAERDPEAILNDKIAKVAGRAQAVTA